jgi:hypothetical protein
MTVNDGLDISNSYRQKLLFGKKAVIAVRVGRRMTECKHKYTQASRSWQSSQDHSFITETCNQTNPRYVNRDT